MNVYKIPHTDLQVSRIAYGCMGIGGRWNSEPMTAFNPELSRKEWYQLFSATRGAPLS